MDILTVVLLIVILILIVNNKWNINEKFRDLEYRITELQNLLRLYQQTKAAESPKHEVKPADVLPTVEEKPAGPPNHRKLNFPNRQNRLRLSPNLLLKNIRRLFMMPWLI